MYNISRLTQNELEQFKSKSCSICPNCSTLQVTDVVCKWCKCKVINLKEACSNGLIKIVDKHG